MTASPPDQPLGNRSLLPHLLSVIPSLDRLPSDRPARTVDSARISLEELRHAPTAICHVCNHRDPTGKPIKIHRTLQFRRGGAKWMSPIGHLLSHTDWREAAYGI
jgi:hypothetical protein